MKKYFVLLFALVLFIRCSTENGDLTFQEASGYTLAGEVIEIDWAVTSVRGIEIELFNIVNDNKEKYSDPVLEGYRIALVDTGRYEIAVFHRTESDEEPDLYWHRLAVSGGGHADFHQYGEGLHSGLVIYLFHSNQELTYVEEDLKKADYTLVVKSADFKRFLYTDQQQIFDSGDY